MKKILFFQSLISIIYSLKIYDLSTNSKRKYNSRTTSYCFINLTKISYKEIIINFTIKNQTKSTFKTETLYYNFSDHLKGNIKKIGYETIESYKNDSFNNSYKIFFRIKKQDGNFLTFKNLEADEDETYVENEIKTSNKAVIAIIIIAVVVVVILIIIFIVVGKSMYNKRQKELMAKYASSFVDNNGLIPKKEEKGKGKDKVKNKKKNFK